MYRCHCLITSLYSSLFETLRSVEFSKFSTSIFCSHVRFFYDLILYLRLFYFVASYYIICYFAIIYFIILLLYYIIFWLIVMECVIQLLVWIMPLHQNQ